MNTKIYEFKPLYKSRFNKTSYNLVLIIFAITIVFLIIYYKLPVYVICVVLAMWMRINLEEKTTERWMVEGYKTIKIDGIHRHSIHHIQRF